MMHKDKLVVVIKNGGKVLREFEDTVYVPFGTEYSIFFKNLNNVRALANITVDGKSATDGVNLVIPANGSVNLERFIKNGNLHAGNKFKFIERTAGVEKHRGVEAEDGLIRVEYRFEKVYPKWEYKPTPWVAPRSKEWWEYQGEVKCKGFNPTMDTYTYNSSDAAGQNYLDGDGGNMEMSRSFTASASAAPVNTALNTGYATPRNKIMKSAAPRKEVTNDVGITAPGAVSNQSFYVADWFATETESHVIVLKLLGETEKGTIVSRPITVHAKPKCTSCGKTNKAIARFCTECGTGLELVA